jgi:hypothetical protein
MSNPLPPIPPHPLLPPPASRLAEAAKPFKPVFEADDTLAKAEELKQRALPQLANVARQLDSVLKQLEPVLDAARANKEVGARFDSISPVSFARVEEAVKKLAALRDHFAA